MLVRPATFCRPNGCIEQRMARERLAIAGEIESPIVKRAPTVFFPFRRSSISI